MALAGRYACVTSTEGLQVFDVKDPAKPQLIGRAAGGPGDVAIRCDHAFVATRGGLEVFDVSNPFLPIRVGQYNEGCPFCTWYTAVTIEGNYAYVAAIWRDFESIHSGMQIFDISNPANPRLRGTYAGSGSPGVWDVTISGNYAYLASAYPNLTVVDVSDPANPQRVSVFDNPAELRWAYTVAGFSNFVYVTDSDGRLMVVDVTNPTSPQRVGNAIDSRVGPLFNPFSSSVAGHRLCVAGLAGIEFLDIRDPAHPRPAATYAAASGPVFLSGSYAYLANSNGLEVIDLSVPANPQRAGSFDLSEPFKSVAVSDHRVYIVQTETWDGATWHSGVKVFDTLDPAHPREVGGLNISNLVPALAASGDYVYLASLVVSNGIALSGNLGVIDFSNPADPQPVGEFEMGGRLYGLALRGRYAYLLEDRRDGTTGGGGGLTILDISNPVDPKRVGGNDDAIRAERFIVSGDRAFAVTNYPVGGLVIIDVSDPASPRRVGGYQARGYLGGIAVEGDYAYLAEQGEWDGRAFVGGGLTVLHVGNPVGPQLVGTFSTGGTARDVALSGHYAYVACAEGGLEVIDITNPAQPRRVGRNSSVQPTSVTVSGDHVYAASNLDGVVILHAFRELEFESVSLRAPSEAVLTISGPPGLIGQVQRSSNLQDWQDWKLVTFSDGPGFRQEISDEEMVRASKRFYRVRLIPSP